MKKWRLGFFFLCLALWGGVAVSCGSAPSLEPSPPSISADVILKTITRLQAFGNRTTWEKQEKVADYLYQQLFRIKGLEVRYHFYSSGGKTWKNVVARCPGRSNPSKVYLFCAHYDSHPAGLQAAAGAPGADDNATGVSVLLEGARSLAENPGRNTLEWVFFSNEEQEHSGSRAYVQDLKAQGGLLAGVINIDTIGYTPSFSKDLWPESSAKGFGGKMSHLIKQMVKKAVYSWQTGLKNPNRILLVGGRPGNAAFVETVYHQLRATAIAVKKDVGPQCG
jgi:hypothetical protein